MENQARHQDHHRQYAEANLVKEPPNDITSKSAEQLLHELQLHQIELEMQNEELRRVMSNLEESRDRYIDFYDFAPVGYLTISRDGMIDEINLTGSTLIGVERRKYRWWLIRGVPALDEAGNIYK